MNDSVLIIRTQKMEVNFPPAPFQGLHLRSRLTWSRSPERALRGTHGLGQLNSLGLAEKPHSSLECGQKVCPGCSRCRRPQTRFRTDTNSVCLFQEKDYLPSPGTGGLTAWERLLVGQFTTIPLSFLINLVTRHAEKSPACCLSGASRTPLPGMGHGAE